MTLFYAWVEVREWGEPDSEERIGPFHPEDPDASEGDQMEDLWRNLEERGEIVNRVEAA